MKYTLYNDDCVKILKKMPTNSIDLVIMDPPYQITGTKGGGSINNVKHMVDTMNELREKDIADGYSFLDVHKQLIRVMNNINIYVWCNKIQIPELFAFYVNQLHCKFDILCWHKTNALPTYYNKYLSDTEYCLYFRKGGFCNPADTDDAYENAKTYYVAPLNQKDKKLYKHPTIKPLELTEKFIKNSSHEGDIVLDPFMGSGTTGVACKKLKRDFIGIEIDKDYFEIAENRISST